MDRVKIEAGAAKAVAGFNELIAGILADEPLPPPPEPPVIEDFAFSLASDVTIRWLVRNAHTVILRVGGQLIEPPAGGWPLVGTVSMTLPPGEHPARLEATNAAGNRVRDLVIGIPVPLPPPDPDETVWSGSIDIDGKGFHVHAGKRLRIKKDAVITFLDLPIPPEVMGHTAGGLVVDGELICEEGGVIFRAQNPDAVYNRGHIKFHAKVTIKGLTLDSLGNSDSRDVSDLNPAMQYPLHGHEGGDATIGSLIEDVVIVDRGTKRPMKKWPVSIHNCNGVTLRNVRVSDMAGWGIGFEGTKSTGCQVLACKAERIYTVDDRKTGEVTDWERISAKRPDHYGSDLGREGAGHWTRAPENEWVDAEATDSYYGIMFYINGSMPSTMIRRYIGRFERFKAVNCNRAVEWWALGGMERPSILKDMHAIDCNTGAYPYPGERVEIHGGLFERCKAVISSTDYLNLLMRVLGITAVDCEWGVRTPNLVSTTNAFNTQVVAGGLVTLRDAVLNCSRGGVAVSYTMAHNNSALGSKPRRMEIADVTCSSPAGQPTRGIVAYTMDQWRTIRNVNVLARNEVHVENYRIEGQPIVPSLRVYSPLQHRDFVMPATVGKRLWASPEAGLSNGQLFERWRWRVEAGSIVYKTTAEVGSDPDWNPVCFGGELAPDDCVSGEPYGIWHLDEDTDRYEPALVKLA